MEATVYERKVYYYETDRMDCVHHSNYIRWFEEARVDLMEKKGFSFRKLEAAGFVSPVLTVQAEYRSMAHFGDEVLVETRMESYSGTRVAFSYDVWDKATGALRCRGKTTHCFLNGAGRPVSLKKAFPEYDGAVRRAMAEG